MSNIRTTLAAALALLALGAVEAATYDWNHYSEEKTASAGRHQWRPFKNESSTLAVAITHGSAVGVGSVASYSTQYNGHHVAIRVNADGFYEVSLDNGLGDSRTIASEIAARAGATDVVGISLACVSGSSSGGPYTYDIRLSVNGATLQVLDDYSFSETLWGRTWLEANSNLDVYQGEGYDIAAIYLQDDKKKDHSAFIESEDLYLSACEELGITPIPEPTALALLALGAVGLALRRRVA